MSIVSKKDPMQTVVDNITKATTGKTSLGAYRVFQRFSEIGIDQIRSENFIHKIHICECLTFFEDSFKMLNDDGKLILKYMDLIAYFKEAYDNSSSIKALEKLEKKIFVQSDPSGLYYNKTLITQNRIEYYLTKVGFKTIQKDEENSDKFNTCLICYKN